RGGRHDERARAVEQSARGLQVQRSRRITRYGPDGDVTRVPQDVQRAEHSVVLEWGGDHGVTASQDAEQRSVQRVRRIVLECDPARVTGYPQQFGQSAPAAQRNTSRFRSEAMAAATRSGTDTGQEVVDR